MKNLFSKNSVIYDLSILQGAVENCDNDFEHIKHSIIKSMELMISVEVNTKNNGVDEELELEIQSFFAASKSMIELLVCMNTNVENLKQITSNIEKMCKDKMKEDEFVENNEEDNFISRDSSGQVVEYNEYTQSEDNNIPF